MICVSATMPSTLDSTLGMLVDLDSMEKVTTTNLHTLHPNVKHIFERVHKYEKSVKVIELLKKDIKRKKATIIFLNRTIAANWLYHYLCENEIKCVRLTSSMTDEERSHSLEMFQNSKCDILVSTDLGSRGLDTKRVNLIIFKSKS